MKCTVKSKYKGKHYQTFMKPRTEIRALPKKEKKGSAGFLASHVHHVHAFQNHKLK